MSKRKVYHVLFKSGEWLIKSEGIKKPVGSSETKKEAIKKAQGIAKKNPLSQLKIHKKNGLIQEERTYGKDPEKYKG